MMGGERRREEGTEREIGNGVGEGGAEMDGERRFGYSYMYM